jgi:hypothetical protein
MCQGDSRRGGRFTVTPVALGVPRRPLHNAHQLLPLRDRRGRRYGASGVRRTLRGSRPSRQDQPRRDPGSRCRVIALGSSPGWGAGLPGHRREPLHRQPLFGGRHDRRASLRLGLPGLRGARDPRGARGHPGPQRRVQLVAHRALRGHPGGDGAVAPVPRRGAARSTYARPKRGAPMERAEGRSGRSRQIAKAAASVRREPLDDEL